MGLRLGITALLMAFCVIGGTLPGLSGSPADSAGHDSSVAPGDSAVQGSRTQSDEADSQPAYVLRPWRALRAHMHNKLIHAPIGFGMAAFFLSLLALKHSELQTGVRWLVLLAAVGAVLAYVSGTSQAEALEGGSKDWVIETHERLGIVTGLVLWGWALALFLRPTRKWTFLLGALALLLILCTGFFGGIIAHG